MKEKELILKFNDDVEFRQVMNENAYDIHNRTVKGINTAFDTNSKEDVIVAYLNDDEHVLGVPEDFWEDNLEMSLDYFITIEDYEKCREIKELMDKLKQ